MLFIFDMGGVVTNSFNFNSFFEKLGLSEAEFFAICKGDPSDDDIWDYLQRGLIPVAEFWQEFNMRIRELDVSPVNHDLFRLHFHPTKNQKVIELVLALRKKHRVVCGTNTIQSHWENHMERGDYSFFDQTYASNKIAAAKPDPEFFNLILNAEDCSPSQAFFTDDKLENCQAAANCGINTIHFTNADDLYLAWQKYF